MLTIVWWIQYILLTNYLVKQWFIKMQFLYCFNILKRLIGTIVKLGNKWKSVLYTVRDIYNIHELKLTSRSWWDDLGIFKTSALINLEFSIATSAKDRSSGVMQLPPQDCYYCRKGHTDPHLHQHRWTLEASICSAWYYDLIDYRQYVNSNA